MLRVYVNDILELAIYNKFNIADKIGLWPHNDLIMGVTASTYDDLANDHTVSNFNIQVARPVLSKFTAKIR